MAGRDGGAVSTSIRSGKDARIDIWRDSAEEIDIISPRAKQITVT